MIDMGQADRTLRHTPSGDNDGVFKRHRERMRRIEMKIKTSALTGVALDWAVAKCEGIEVRQVEGVLVDPLGLQFSPSIDWSYGGMVIEREKIELTKGNPLYFPDGNEKGDYYEDLWIAGKYHGQTPLIAAMRCYVASKLGDEVEIPEELK